MTSRGTGTISSPRPVASANGGTYAAMPDFESSATKGVLMVGGHKVYTLYMDTREGYRTPLERQGQGRADGQHGPGHLRARGRYARRQRVLLGLRQRLTRSHEVRHHEHLVLRNGLLGQGRRQRPLVHGRLRGWGLGRGSASGTGNTNSINPSMKVQFALGVLHTPVGKYALRMANVETATDLTTAYDGDIPSGKTWGNAGGIVLGVGGDNSNNSCGTFYEGAVTNGSPSNATDLLVMKNIQAAGYGK